MAEIKIIDHTTTVSSPDVNYKLYGTLIESGVWILFKENEFTFPNYF